MLLTHNPKNPSAHNDILRYIYSDLKKNTFGQTFLDLIHNFHFTTYSWPAKPKVF